MRRAGEKGGRKVSLTFHESDTPDDATTAKILERIDTKMGLLCFNLSGKVKNGLANQEESESITVAEDHGQCFTVLLALADSSLNIDLVDG